MCEEGTLPGSKRVARKHVTRIRFTRQVHYLLKRTGRPCKTVLEIALAQNE